MPKVGDIMRPDTTTVTRATPLKEVAETLLRTGLPGLLVVDDAGRVIGVVLVDDLVLRGAGPEHLVPILLQESPYEVMDRLGEESRMAEALTAGDIMRTNIPHATEDAPLLEVADCMADARCDLVPVVRKGKPVGVVTKHDLLRSVKWRDEAEPAPDKPESA